MPNEGEILYLAEKVQNTSFEASKAYNDWRRLEAQTRDARKLLEDKVAAEQAAQNALLAALIVSKELFT